MGTLKRYPLILGIPHLSSGDGYGLECGVSLVLGLCGLLSLGFCRHPSVSTQVFVATTRFNVVDGSKTEFEDLWNKQKDKLQERLLRHLGP